MPLIDDIYLTIVSEPGLSDSDIVIRHPGGPSRHQQVNQRCRQLVALGKIDRKKRPSGKIGNFPSEANVRRSSATQMSEQRQKPQKDKPTFSNPIPSTNFSVSFRWFSAGEITIDGNEKIRFPQLTTAPAIYKLCFTAQRALYIGESIQLKRRMQNYRTPGPTQQTSIWVGKTLKSAMSSSETVFLNVCTDVTLSCGEEQWDADLSSKTVRLFVESAAILAEARGSWKILNKAT